MPIRHGGSFTKTFSIRPRLKRSRITAMPSASTPCTWNMFFAKSNPIVVTFFIVALPYSFPQIILREGWRAVHVITSGRSYFGSDMPARAKGRR
jgi:hypothetical protein